MVSAKLLFVLGAIGLATLRVSAASPVTVSVTPVKITLAPEGTAIVRLNFAIADAYHIYSTVQSMGSRGPGPTATTIAVRPEQIVAVDGGLKSSPSDKHYDPDFELDVGTLEGRVWIDVPLKAAVNAAPGMHSVVLVVSYQACTEESCLPPADVEVPLEVVVAFPSADSGAGKHK